MGDWSNNPEYEQREYYGHLYDTDEGVHEEEETDDLISKQKVLNTLDFADSALTDEERTVENFKAILTECINVLSSDSEYPNKCFDGMTNGEVLQAGLQALFPNISVYEHGSTYSVNNEYNFNATWWNAPYKADMRGEADEQT